MVKWFKEKPMDDTFLSKLSYDFKQASYALLFQALMMAYLS